MKCELKQIKHDAEKEAKTYNKWTYIKLGGAIIIITPFHTYFIPYMWIMYLITIVYILCRLYDIRDKCSQRRK